MFCLQCGAANPDDASVCSQCNQAIKPVTHLPGAPPGAAWGAQPQLAPVQPQFGATDQPAAACPKSVTASVACVAGAFLILLLTAWAYAPKSLLNEVIWPEGVGAAFALFLIAGTCAFLGFGRKRNWHGCARCFAAVTGFGFVMTMGANGGSSVHLGYDVNKSMITLVRQASGVEPPTDRTPAEKALRELFAEMFARRNAYQEKAKSFRDSPEAQDLLQPVSYRSIDSIEATKKQLTLMIDADTEMKQYMETGVMQSARRTIDGLRWS